MLLTTAPRLRIRRPSPTTAEFSVTTRPTDTLPLRLLWLLLLVLRVLLSLTTFLVLYAVWVQERDRFTASGGLVLAHVCSSSSSTSSPSISSISFFFDKFLCLLESFQATAPGKTLARIASSVPLPALLPIALLTFYALSLRTHTEESILVLRGLGVQTSESPTTYLAKTATRFIPTEKIQDVFVNEAFRGFEVRYYLVVVVEGEDEVVVVFPSLLPKRRIVETVWRGIRECLYEENKVHVHSDK